MFSKLNVRILASSKSKTNRHITYTNNHFYTQPNISIHLISNYMLFGLLYITKSIIINEIWNINIG